MELFKEYVDLVNFYDQNSSKPVTKTDLVPICELPEIFELFGIQYQNKILAVGSKHLYTMQLSDGYYSISRDTHYHDLKKDVMLELPKLISEPALVFYDFSEQQQIQNEKPSTLVFILDKEIQRTDAETGKSTDETLVCYINESLNPDDRMTILATAFTKSKLDNYINNLIRNNRLLYLNEKKLHTRDLSGIQLAKSATMPLTGASLNNIRNYRENVNEKRMKESGLFLKDIPDEEKTEHVCKTAILNNPLAFQYIPENRISQSLIFTLIEKQNRFSFKFIPEDKFLDGVHYYFRKTKNHKKRPDIIYKDLLRLMTEKQQTMFLTEINKEKEPSVEEATRYIVEHSNNNISMRASRIPSHVQSVSDSIMSFDKNPAGVLEIIGKRFEVGQDGKPTLEGFKALSRAMEIYSDKHYETARYLFIKDGKITRHVAVSSQTPASTIIKPADSFLYELKSYARETGSRIVFLHNHPSGYVEPSGADVELTDYLSNFFTDSDGTTYFSGHIILDHGTYGLWSQKSRKWNALIDNSLQPISKIGETYKIQLSKYGKRVELEENGIATTSLMELSEFARECDAGNLWNTKDWVPGFLLTGNGIVTSFEQFGNFEFEDESVLCSKLKQLGRSYGSENIVFFPRSKEQFLMCERFAQDTGVVKDIYFENKDGIYELSQYNGGNIFNNTRIDEIKVDDTQNYEEEVMNKIKAEDSSRDNLKKIKGTTYDSSQVVADPMTEHSSPRDLNIKDLNKTVNKNNNVKISNVEKKESFSYTERVNKITNKENKLMSEKTKSVFNQDIVETKDLSSEQKKLRDEYFHLDFRPGTFGELKSIENFFDFYNHEDERVEFLKSCNEVNLFDTYGDTNAVEQYLSHKFGMKTRFDEDWNPQFYIANKEFYDGINWIAQGIVKREEDIHDAILDGKTSETERKAGRLFENYGISNVSDLEKYVSKNLLHKDIEQEIEQKVEGKIIDDGIESIQVNGGMSDAASEADILSRENNLTEEESIEISGEEIENILNEENNLSPFEYDGLTYIPVRCLTAEEKEMINNRTPKQIWNNSIIEKPKNGKDYSIEKFKKAGNIKDIDLFYCIERGKFFTPIEKGIINLNEGSINNHFRDELDRFYNNENIQKIVKANRPLLFNEEKDISLMKNISSVLSEYDVFNQTNETIGDIRLKFGNIEHGGLSHTIKRRMDKLIEHNGLSFKEAQKETTTILFLAIKNISEAPATKETSGRHCIYKNGIKTAIGKDKNGKYFVTGFDFDDTKKEAVDAIMSVNAHYEYTPEFLEIYAQVGATYASLINNIAQQNSPVNEKEHPAAEFQNKEFEQLKTSFESLQEKLNDVLKQNNELRKENEMLRNQQSVSDEKSANESISQNNKKQEMSDSQCSQGGRVDTSFNRETAFKSNTKVPVFGHYNNDTRKIEIIKNAVFERKIEDDYDNSMNKIVLAIPHENGEHTQLVITEREYNKMINAVEKLEEVKRTISDDTWEWTKAHQDYNEVMNLDRKIYRLNTPANFLHNFRVHCIKEVHNPEDAMKIAALMVQDMTPRDKQQFNKMRRDYDKQYGKGSYDRLLLKEFEEISKEKEISPELLQSDFTNGFTILKGMNRELNELKKGQEINGTHIKVGDTIPLSLKCKTMDGKRIIIPMADYKIEKVTQNMIPNRAVLVNTKTNAIEIMPLNDLVTHIQKVEKKQTKEVNKEMKKQHREYGYDGR